MVVEGVEGMAKCYFYLMGMQCAMMYLTTLTLPRNRATHRKRDAD